MITVQVYEFFNPVSLHMYAIETLYILYCLIISDYLHLCCLLMSHRYFSCRPCISSQKDILLGRGQSVLPKHVELEKLPSFKMYSSL